MVVIVCVCVCVVSVCMVGNIINVGIIIRSLRHSNRSGIYIRGINTRGIRCIRDTRNAGGLLATQHRFLRYMNTRECQRVHWF